MSNLEKANRIVDSLSETFSFDESHKQEVIEGSIRRITLDLLESGKSAKYIKSQLELILGFVILEGDEED